MNFLFRAASVTALLCSFLITEGIALAEERRIQLSQSALAGLQQIVKEKDAPGAARVSKRYEKLARALRLSGSDAKLGRFRVHLPIQKFFAPIKGVTGSAFLQGRAFSSRAGNGTPLVSFATVTFRNDKTLLVRAFLPSQSRKNKKLRLSEVRISAESEKGVFKVSSVRVSQSKRELARHLACINSARSETPISEQTVHSKDFFTVTKLLLEADTEYAALVPNFTEEMATVANGTDAIYRTDLGIAFDVTIDSAAKTYTTPIILDENFTFPIHEEMAIQRSPATRNADVHFLLTGKEPVGEDIRFLLGAVPDLGTVCRVPALSVGFTIRTNTSEDILTTAHEVGHLFGGEHDDDFTEPTNRGVMHSGTTAIFNLITNFSDFSKAQIAGFVQSTATCLPVEDIDEGDDGDPDPQIQYSVLPFKFQGYFAAEVTDQNGDAAASVTVTVLKSAKKKSGYKVFRTGISDAQGLFSFKPRKIGFYKFSVAGVESTPLRLKKKKAK